MHLVILMVWHSDFHLDCRLEILMDFHLVTS